MRRALILSVLLAAACASSDVAVEVDRAQDLAAFDKDNPACQLWTNWQKMCSRSGPNGETFCKEDPAMPVEPSATFCVVDNAEAYNRIETYSKAQYDSYMRFCEGKSSTSWAHVSGSTEAVASCVSYRQERPFNGYHLEARRHPWCQKWGTLTAWDKPGANEVVVSEDTVLPEANRVTCKTAACARRIAEDGLSCIQDQLPNWCSGANWMHAWGRPNSDPPDPDRVVVDGLLVYLRPDVPVVGGYCRYRFPEGVRR